MWLRSHFVLVLLIFIIHIGSGEQNIRSRRQSSPSPSEKYQVYVKPLPTKNKPSQQNKLLYSFSQEREQPFQHLLYRKEQPKEQSGLPLKQYRFPLPPQSQQQKWRQPSNVQAGNPSSSQEGTQTELRQQFNIRAQYQLPIQPIRSDPPETSSQKLLQYQVPSKPSSHTHLQQNIFPEKPHHQLSVQENPSEKILNPHFLHSKQRQSWSLDQISNHQPYKTSQTVKINGQLAIISPVQSHVSLPSQTNQDTSSSHAFLPSPTTDVIFQDKLFGSLQPQLQSVIQKAPASEIEHGKGIPANDKSNSDNEYVVYYYYYYDDVEGSSNKTNTSLKFDEVPNLENYDQTKTQNNISLKDEKKIKAKGKGNASIDVINNDFPEISIHKDHSLQQQPETLTLKNIPPSKVDKDSSSPIIPISNVYRYGNNVPHFPLTPDYYSSKRQRLSSLVTVSSVEHKKHKSFSNHDVATSPLSGDSSAEFDILDSVNNNASTVVKSNEIIEVKSDSLARQNESSVEVKAALEPTTTENIIATTEAAPTLYSSRRRFGPRRIPGFFRSRKPPISALTTSITNQETNENKEITTVSTTTTTSRNSRFKSRLGNRRTSFGVSRRRPSFNTRNRFGIFSKTEDEKKNSGEETTTISSTTFTETLPSTTIRRFENSQSESPITETSGSHFNGEITTSTSATATLHIRPNTIFGRSRSRPRLPFLRRGRNRLNHGAKQERESNEEKPKKEDLEVVKKKEFEEKENGANEERKSKEEKFETVKRDEYEEKEDKTGDEGNFEVSEKGAERKSKEKDDKVEREKPDEKKGDEEEEDKIKTLISTLATTTTLFPLLKETQIAAITEAVKENGDFEEEEPQAATKDPTTTTTESSRFSGLFRKRKRPTLFGNRPRPNLFNRSG
ncbi:uncharacterized protein LOC143252745 [Tachypleus tridentatus]|uniref:uncharacterized protein LOC143252745 n=1 Tax=Tachypleus tridentatus TaxID=6853 RepID=UPI003FD651DE